MSRRFTTLAFLEKFFWICTIVSVLLSVQDGWAQDKDKPKKEKKKKAKLPPEDLSGVMLANIQYSFTSSGLKGVTLNNPTSLQFGPDGRLYVSQQNGVIQALTIVRNAANDYAVTATETIGLINQIPNYNDDGTINTSVKTRQVTGLLLTGTETQPIIYVSSSDSRIGGGSSAGDKNLDTNSGIVSRLTKKSSGWAKVDLVRGLPRSEENHAVNGMQLDEQTNTLYLTVGGFTNAGSPSNNFAFISEYALSAAILSIDLDAVEALPTQISGNTAYKYNLPTLDDPSRSNNLDGSDVNDPFGGNDGLNQAKIVLGGPVQVFSPGYRNAYDLVITKTLGKERRMYTVDNGPNQGWGGHPEREGSDGTVTNNYVAGEPGSTGPGPNDPKVNNLDNLHFIGNLDTYIPGTHYAGHPTPIRANPAGAGLYTHDGSNGVWRTGTTGTYPLPVDWPPIPVEMANPVEGDYQNPGETDLALLTFSSSTNGLVEYTASNFDGSMQGSLLAAGYNGNIYKINLTEDGLDVTNFKSSTNKLNQDIAFASGFGSQPLDVTAQGDNDVFPGSVWAATYGSDVVTIFEPGDFTTCTGKHDVALDEDSDGYSNADEIDNATNPCSASSMPPDFDKDYLSDLNDPNDDNDGLGDNLDYFAIDAKNGLNTYLPIEYNLFNNDPGTGLFGLGFTGLMSNKKLDNDWYNLYYEENLIAGGAVGAFSVVEVSAGDAYGTLNNQENGFQFGVNVSSNTGPFTVQATMLGPFFNNQVPQNFQSQGLYIGTGDQDNYLKITLNANSGQGGFEVVYENAGQPSVQQFSLSGGMPGSSLDLFLSVDPVLGTVQPKYSQDGGEVTSLGFPIQVSGFLLEAIQGAPALAVGIISTSRDAVPFTATWDLIKVTVDPVTATGSWQTHVPANGAPTARHENSFIQAGDKFYLLGGRGMKPVQVYDPVTKTWANKANTPSELHHFQAVTIDGLIYVLGAFTGAYPYEKPVPKVYIYNPVTDKWLDGPSIPESRRRGAAGVVVHNKKIYLVSGITDGHNSGHVTWFDEYDPVTNAWKTMPDAPRARDHCHAAIINNKLYLAGGRRTSYATGEVFKLTVPEVDVFDFETNLWVTLPSSSNIPTQRAGTAIAVLGDELIVIGGESASQSTAHVETEALNINTNSWRRLSNLVQGRHGTQAITSNNGIYIVAGSGSRGGSPELSSQEAFYMFAPSAPDGIALTQSQLKAPSTVDFGVVEANTTSSKTISISNTEGNQDIAISAITIKDASSFSYIAPYALPFVLPVGKSVDVTVIFSPTTSEAQTANMVINHSGLEGSTIVALSGGLSSVSASPSNLHFFSQQAGTTSEAQSVTVTNNTLSSVEISSVSIAGTNSSEFAHNFTGTVILAAGASKSIGVTFTPTSLGTKVAELNITHSGSNSPLAVGLTGEGVDNTGNVTATFRINSGGGEVVNSIGTFAADNYFSPVPGYTYSKVVAIAGTEDDAMYQTERSSTTNNGTFSYVFPVSNGQYTVILHFAELYHTAVGKRVFDVSLEGTKVLDNYDIFQKVGAQYKVTTETFTASVTDGALNMLFSAMASDGGVNRPKISAIEVKQVTGTNQAPVANAGLDQAVSAGADGVASVQLDGSGSTDADGSIASYVWTEAGTQLATGATPTVSLGVGSHIITLTVTDDEGAPDTDQVTVTVNPASVENQAPVANAGPDKAISYPSSSVTLNGSGTDTDGTISSYNWIQQSGPNTASLSGPGTKDLTASSLIAGTYVFRLTVTDNAGAIGFDDASVTVSSSEGVTTYRINAGGIAVTNSIGSFAADGYFSPVPGYTYSTTKSISGTLDDAMYQTERSSTTNNGTFSYVFPVSNGQYTVILHFAELYHTAVGKRVFDVSLEGTKVLDNYDIFQKVGAQYKVTTETFTASVTDGALNMLFSAMASDGGVNRPKISAIEVKQVTGTNQAPVANAGLDQAVSAGADGVASVQLDGSGSTDADGSIASYVWTEAGTQLATGATPTVSLGVGSHIITLTVTDDEGAPDTDQVTVTVNPAPVENQAPVADAGDDQAVSAGADGVASVQLDGSGSTDADGSIASYVWTEAGTQLATGATPTVSLGVGSHIITLTVTDDEGAPDTDQVTVTVNPAPVENQAPVADAGDDQAVSAGADGVASVQLDGSGSTDADGSIASYVWMEAGTQLATGATPTVSLGVGSHIITLTVTDDEGAPDTDQVTVTVNPAPVENQAPVADAGDDQAVSAGADGVASVQLDGSGSTDADGSIASYVWTEAGTQLATGATPTVSLGVGSHIITLTVTDDEGAPDTDQVTVTVNPAPVENQAPVADAGDDQAVSAGADGVASVQLDGSGSTDADGSIASYVWTEAGTQLATGATPTVSLGVGSHIITLTVTDDEGAPDTDQVTVTVNPVQNSGQKVVSFTLVDAVTSIELYTLTDGSTINLAHMPNRSINIRANTSPSIVGSVVFNLTGIEASSTKDNKIPYALKGDANGKYHKWIPSIGTYTLSATPFTLSGGGGNTGSSLTVNFTVVDQAVSQTATQTLVRTATESSAVTIYPNPFNESINIKIQTSDSQEYIVKIYNTIGYAIYSGNFKLPLPESDVFTIDLSKSAMLQGEIYLISVENMTGTLREVVKVLKE